MFQFAASPLMSLALAAGMAAAGLAVYYAFVRLVEQRQVHELGLTGMGRELGLGLLIGAGLCILCVLALMVLGVYRIDGINPAVVMLPALAMSLSAGVLEELMYRGGLFRIVEESLGSWISLAVSALVFGLSHYAPVDGALWGSFAITIEAGLLLAAAYMLTRRLWISIGLHVAWNFAQSGVFSGIVSGSFNQPGLFKSTLEGSDWLTGGAFGMEASLVAVVVCTAAGLLLLMLAMRRGHLVPPFWLRARPDPIMPTA
jgi:membrane protease YdiL (CAAX protease family)